MHAAIDNLELDHLILVHSGRHRIQLTDKITAIAATELLAPDTALDGL